MMSGLYTRKKLTERLCRFCDCNVEDEIHFIGSCPNLNNVISYYYPELNIDVDERFLSFRFENNSWEMWNA